MSLVVSRTRGTTVLAALTLFFAFAFASSAWAAPDYDGDGVTGAADCDPLDGSVAPGKPDRPDLEFKDTNCDGIDGDQSKAVFVSVSGNNLGTGSKENPLQTIGAGITKAKAEGKDVLVTGGTYNELVNLESNVSIFGGYRPITGVRSADEVTTIVGSPQPILASGDTGVELQQLTLRGTPDAARNVYGFRALGGSAVVLSRVTTQTANATAGPAGGAGGNGPAGGNGGGGNIYSQGGTSAGGTRGSGANQGGLGGKGNTAASGDPGENGGGGTLAGVFGAGGTQTTPAARAGANGGPGTGGAAGGAGANGLAPSAASGFGSTVGTTGTNGNPGGGGGGGGAGAGHPNACNSAGAYSGMSGGGGGGGGTGGFGGVGGTSGGGAFGVYVHNSVVTAIASTLGAGDGGAGGAGGAGGGGGDGGKGGAGYKNQAVQDICFLGNGGDGGKGGAGGGGGGGGGGAGGPSAGIYKAGTGSFVLKQTTLAPGSAGQGGLPGGGGARAVNGSTGGAQPNATDNPTADFDGDGVTDVNDACPARATGGTDANGDGCPDEPSKLADSDGDGIPDSADACVSTPRGNDANEDGCPDPPPIGGGGGGAAPGGGTGGAAVDPTQILIAFPFAFSKSTKKFTIFTALAIKAIPIGSTLKVVCKSPKGKCPGGSSFTKKNAFGTVKLKKWIKKKIRAGTKITATVTKPGNYIGAVKIMTVRKKNRPKFTDRCLPPGTTRPVGC